MQVSSQALLIFETGDLANGAFDVLSAPFIDALCAKERLLQSAGSSGSESLQQTTPALLGTLLRADQGDVSPMESLAVAHSLALHAGAVVRAAISIAAPDYLDIPEQSQAFQYADKAISAPAASTEANRNSKFVKSVDAPTIGHAHKSLNRISAAFSFKIAVARQQATAQTATIAANLAKCGAEFDTEAVSAGCPWVDPTGALLQSEWQRHAVKVLAILADRPGSTLASLHACFPLLTKAHLQLLVDALVDGAEVRAVTTMRSVRRSGPFDRTGATGTSDTVYFTVSRC